MDTYKFGELLEKSRRDNVISAARAISDYCSSVNECEKECVFYNQLTGRCTFTKYNSYGEPKAPEDWEV